MGDETLENLNSTIEKYRGILNHLIESKAPYGDIYAVSKVLDSFILRYHRGTDPQ